MQVEARNTLTRCRDIFITHIHYMFLTYFPPLVRDVNILHKINLAYRALRIPSVRPAGRPAGGLKNKLKNKNKGPY